MSVLRQAPCKLSLHSRCRSSVWVEYFLGCATFGLRPPAVLPRCSHAYSSTKWSRTSCRTCLRSGACERGWGGTAFEDVLRHELPDPALHSGCHGSKVLQPLPQRANSYEGPPFLLFAGGRSEREFFAALAVR